MRLTLLKKINKMNQLLLSLAMIHILFSGCENIREKSAEELLQNEKMEADVYTAILMDRLHLN